MEHKFLYKIKNENGQIKGEWYVINAYWREQGLDVRDRLGDETYKSIEDAKEIIERMKRILGDIYEFEALEGSLV